MSSPEPTRVVVVGGGVGGVSTCAALRAAGYRGQLILIDAGEFPYDRPPLSKGYLLGEKDDAAIALQPADWYVEQGIELISQARVVRIDPHVLTVETDAGIEVSGDVVVLATGGRALRPAIPGIDDEQVHVIRDVDDARRLREALRPGSRVLVVGAGLIGAEVASTLVDLGADVVLTDPLAYPLASVVGEELAAWMHGVHGTRGITVRQAGVVDIASVDHNLAVTLTDASEAILVDLVVVGVGMAPAEEIAATGGLDVDRGVLVDENQQTSRPRIYAVGDVARRRDADGTVAPRAEHWEAAQHDAQRLAAHLMDLSPPSSGAPWFWSDRHGRHIEVVGNLADAPTLVWRGAAGDDPFTVFAVDGRRVVGAFSVDDGKAVRAARRLIDGALEVDPSALADASVDLRKLVRR